MHLSVIKQLGFLRSNIWESESYLASITMEIPPHYTPSYSVINRLRPDTCTLPVHRATSGIEFYHFHLCLLQSSRPTPKSHTVTLHK